MTYFYKDRPASGPDNSRNLIVRFRQRPTDMTRILLKIHIPYDPPRVFRVYYFNGDTNTDPTDWATNLVAPEWLLNAFRTSLNSPWWTLDHLANEYKNEHPWLHDACDTARRALEEGTPE